MKTISIGSTLLLLGLAACGQADPPSDGQGTQGGATSGGSPAGGRGGSSGNGGGVVAGGVTGGTSSGAAGGTASGGTGGSLGGSPAAGTGGNGVGGVAGTPNAGGGGAGMSSGGAGMSSGGMNSGGMNSGGAAGADTTGPVTVQLAQTHQKIEGFGINDTYASSAMPAHLFDATDGIGLTILRIGMGSDGKLKTSNVQTPDIAMVKAVAGTKIIGSCWSAPKECKSNNNENDGGHLNTDCYESWGKTITKFAKDNALYAMSVVNEPDFASCGLENPCNGSYPTMLYTANEMVAFIKVVGPMLQEAGVKVIAPEASEWNHLWSNESAGPNPGGKNSSDPLKCGFPPSNPVCDEGGGYDYGHYLAKDAAAWAAIDIIGAHEYDSQQAYPWPSDVTAERKQVWQTEMSGVKWWPEEGPSTDIANGVAVAGWIHSALVVGDASAWLYWWYSTSNDNEGLYVGTTDTKRHYTMGNYSKFVRPGFTRVAISGKIPADVLLSAFSGPDGTVAVVAINKSKSAVSVPISVAGGTVPASMTPWVTSASDNLASKAAVPVSDGSFTAELGATTVTTFVGK